MDNLALSLMRLGLLAYVAGAVAGLLFLRRERLANLVSFGCATVAALCGLLSYAGSLATGAAASSPPSELFPSLIPYVRFSIHADALGCFFGLASRCWGWPFRSTRSATRGGISGARMSGCWARSSTGCFCPPRWSS